MTAPSVSPTPLLTMEHDNMWHCLFLDLHDDAALIAAYRDRHRAVPPAVLASIRAAGIEAMDIYQRDDRLVMMMRTGPGFDPEAKAAAASPASSMDTPRSSVFRFGLSLRVYMNPRE